MERIPQNLGGHIKKDFLRASKEEAVRSTSLIYFQCNKPTRNHLIIKTISERKISSRDSDSVTSPTAPIIATRGSKRCSQVHTFEVVFNTQLCNYCIVCSARHSELLEKRSHSMITNECPMNNGTESKQRITEKLGTIRDYIIRLQIKY